MEGTTSIVINSRKAGVFEKVWVLLLFLTGIYSSRSYATITVTAASATICTNYAASGPAPHWTALGTMTIKEGANADLGNVSGAWTVTLTLAPPTGWQFDATTNPTLAFTAARNITSVTQSSISSTSLVIVIAGTNKTSRDQFTITGLRVQPLTTSASSGNIHPSSIVGTMSGVTTSKSFGTLSRSTATSGTASISITVSPTGTICSGTPVTFSSSTTNGGTAPTYQWKLGGSAISGATNSSYTSSSLANANAITCALISNSCITSPTATSNTITMSVNQTPDLTNFSSQTATSPCYGSGSTVTVNSATLGSGTFVVNYSLSGANNGSGFTDNLTMSGASGTFPIQSYILDTAGTSTITVNSLTSTAGCAAYATDSNTATFTVNALPTAVTVSGSGTFCGSDTLTASNGGSGTIYFEGTTTGGTSTAAPTVAQVVSASGTYYFRAQSSAGCWGTEDNATVTINPLPTAVTVSGGGSYCGSTTITASNGGSGTIYYQGTTSGGTSTINASSSQVISSSGTYYFRALSSIGCWGPEGSITVTINPNPAPITGTQSVCTGSTTSLGDISTGGSWTSSNTAIATVVSGSGLVSGVTNGLTTITYTLTTGCIVTAPVTVNAVPGAISGATALCSGSSTTFSDAVLYGAWSSSNTSTATIDPVSGLVQGVANGSVTISYNTGCGSVATRALTIGNSPVTGNLYICSGSTSSLSDATTGGTWSSGATSIATVGVSSGIVTGGAAGTVTISYSSGSCIATAIVTVNVAPASVSGTAVACAGSSSTLTDATPYGTWSSSNTAVATVGTLTGSVSAVAAGVSTITYSTGCGTAATKVFTVNALPAAISGTSSVCIGSATSLSDGTGGGTWSSGATSVATVGTAGSVTGVSAGNATISYTMGTGCYVTNVVTVNSLPSSISGTKTVCAGASTTLSDGGGGTWASSNTSVATVVSSTGVVWGVTSGTATITYTLPIGCTATSVVTINPLPSVISGTYIVCVGATNTLSDAGGGTWTSSNPSRATVGSATGIVTGLVAGNLTITYALPTGCSTTASFTVNPLPASISGTRSVCVGATTNLSDAGGGTWSSASTGIATVGSSTGVVTGATAGNANIIYTLPTGCALSAAVTVNPLPNAGTITGATDFCQGSTISLTDAVAGGTWGSSDTTLAVVDGYGNVNGVGYGMVSISYTYTNVCGTAFTSVSMNVNPLPNVDTINGIAALCAGTTFAFTNSVSGGIWTSTNTAAATVGSASGIVTGVSGGSTLISYSLTNSCGVDFDTMTVVINAAPAAISGTTNICVAASASLSDGTGGGTWSSSTTSVATVGSTGSVYGVSAGTTTISYMLGTGCQATKIVTINPLPSAISGTTVVCLGSSSTLTDAGGGTWSSSATSVATVGASSGTVYPVSTGSTTITYVLPTGCKTSTPVTVNYAPSLSSATNSSPICAGVTLTLTANSPSHVASYSWSGPIAVTSSTSSSSTVPSATTAAAGTYTVTVGNGSGAGCSVNYTTTATVNATPAAAPTNNSPVCTGGTATLTSNPSGSTSVYAWSGSGLSSTTAQNPTVTPTVTTTYSLTVTNGTAYPGCSPGTVYTTTVTVSPVPTAAPSNSGPICNASTVTLSANPSGGANTYAWSGAGLSSNTVQNPTATPTVTTTYSVTVSYGTGHPGCSPSTVYTTTVTVRPTGYWLGGTNNNWAENSNWCGNIPVAATSVLIPSGATYYPNITSGTYPANGVTIQSGASVTVNGGTLQVGGAISNSGTFTVSSGTIEMNGSSAQTIPSGAFAGNAIKNLTVNNSAGVTVSGALSVSGILKAANGNLSSGGNVTLLSTSSQTALIDGSGSGEVLGNVTMQCYLDSGYGYRYISSPFTAATVGGISPAINLTASFPLFYSNNENVNSSGWVADTTASSVLSPLHGYAGNFGASFSPVTLSLTGVVSNHSVSVTLYNHNQTYTQGYNLVGNPYPSPIDWDATTGWTKTNINNAVYYFNASDTNQYTGTYSSYVAGVSSDGIASNIIASMQGFFVRVSSGTYPVTATLATDNGVRVNNLTPVFHKKTYDQQLLRVDAGFAGSGAHADPAVIYFKPDAADTFNDQSDALKIMNTDPATPSLYSLSPDNGARFSIKALPPVSGDTRMVPLGLQTMKDGTIAFIVRNIDNLPSGLHAYFYDTHAGIVNDLVTNPSYSLQLPAGKYENRFFIMFTYADKISIPGYNDALNAYTSGQSLYVYVTSGDGDLSVTDLAGRQVARQHLSGNGYHEIRLRVNTGVYIATLISNMGKQSRKVFIGNE